MKTAQGLVDFCKARLGCPYMYGNNGHVITEYLIQAKAKQYPDHYPPTRIEQLRRHLGEIGYDCSSLADLYITPDRSANGWYASCVTKGPISTIPDKIGLMVHRDGHMGHTIGNGQVIEARAGVDDGTTYTRKVMITDLDKRGWTGWGMFPRIEYGTVGEVEEVLQKGDKGDQVTYWQRALLRAGYKLPLYGADSDFGSETEAATKAFQTASNLPVTGIVNTITFAYMLNVLQGITSADPAIKAELDAAKLKIASLTVDLNNEKSLVTQASDSLRAEQERAQKLRDALSIIKSY